MEIVKLAINLDFGGRNCSMLEYDSILVLLMRGSMDKDLVFPRYLPANHVNSMGTE